MIDWARAVQGFELGADWAGAVLGRALEEADPGQYPVNSSSFAFCADIANPMMALVVATAGTAEAFNDALRKVLEAHRSYYGERRFSPPQYQENDPRGFIALGPLAFAVAMRARGWPITVESDYLPRSLIEPSG
jgi:hypothetical protein